LAFSNVKGYRGLLRATISESFIAIGTLEFIARGIKLKENVKDTKNLKLHKYEIVKLIFLLILIVNEIYGFYPQECNDSELLSNSARNKKLG